ncbi:MAG: hypothetical protein KBB55_02940 [Candidatus Buchananbacteria bacterium]|nr:hypothetical protein [Candidatus Buchananbacteria bacterium]
MQNIAIVFQCGGMRNAFTQGALKVVGDLLQSRANTVYAASSGVETALYWLSNQPTEAKDVWLHQLTRPEVCGFRNLFRFGRLANVHYLVDVCCRELDIEAVLQSPVKVKVGVVCTERAETRFVELNRHNQQSLRKATCALPLLASPILLDNRLHLDGGTLDALPVEMVCREEQFSKVVVFANRPPGLVETHRLIERYLAFPINRGLRRGFAERSQRLERSWEFINQHPDPTRLFVVAPPQPVPATRLCRNPGVMEETWDMGESYGHAILPQLEAFLNS